VKVLYRLNNRLYLGPKQQVKPKVLHKHPIKIRCQKTIQGVEKELEKIITENGFLQGANAVYFVPHQSIKTISWPEGWSAKDKDYTELPTVEWSVRFYKI